MTLLSCFSASGLGLGIVFSVVFFRSKYYTVAVHLHIIIYNYMYNTVTWCTG